MTPREYDLCAWWTVDGVQSRKLFPRTRMHVSPEQRSAVILFLDARRRETPTSVPFDGGVDIYTGSKWIPFTNLNGADMWSRKIRTGKEAS